MRHQRILFALLSILLSTSLFSQTLSKESLDEFYRQGSEHLQAFRFQEALNHFFECQRTEPNNTEYLSKVGYCYYQLGNLMEARIYFSQALKKDSTHVSSLNYLATIEEQLMDNKAAMSAMIRLLVLDSTNSYYNRLAGSLAEKLGDGFRALFFYLKALKYNPNDNAALVSLCNLYAGSERLDMADSLLNTAIHKQPNNLRLLYTSADVNYRLRQFDEAVMRIQKALELGDTSITFLPVLPYSLAQLERCEEAIPWFEYTMARRNPTEQAHYFLGFCYQKMQDYEKSLLHFKMAIQLGISQNMPVYYQRTGDVKAIMKDYKSAVAAYEKALGYGASDPVISFHLGIGYDHLHKKDKRRPLEFYRKYLRANDMSNPEFRKYAAKRIGEIEDYQKNVWKGE